MTRATGRRAVAALAGVDEWRRTEVAMIGARWFGVAFALFQVALYDAPDAPAAVKPIGFALAGLLAVTNIGVQLGLRRITTVRAARRLAWATLLFDAALISAYVWLYAFDDTSSLYLLFFVLPAEAALKFEAVGALTAWAACTGLYVARELWAAGRYGFEVEVDSITFRMGILLLVSVILGLFARKLADRTQELADALDELEHQERWRQALIDMLAHDLRAPVGSAASTMMLLRDRGTSLEPAQVQQLAAAAVRHNERALRLTQDLLDLARSQQGKLELHRDEVALEPLLRRVIDLVAPADADIAVVVDADLHVDVDAVRFEQVVANLVGNAAKHGRPPLEVSARATADDGLELRVTDSGEGVAPSQQDTLFTPFAVGSRRDSVGLGLWVVRTLVEAHGGSVAYDPVAGRPSFVVRLPAAAPTTTAAAVQGRL